MADRPLLSATLIAKDEKHNVRRCLDSIWPHVDQVVVCDTGSKDGTVAALRAYAKERHQPGKLKIVRHKWTDDFAAARQVADDAATGQWYVWADFDDVVIGLEQLREMAANATDEVVAFFTRYSYARDQDGLAISELWRERVVRNNGTRWDGRLHEHKLFLTGSVVTVDPTIAEWVHHRDHAQRTGERNLRILEDWLKQEPDNGRVISSVAMEYMGQDRQPEAVDMFARYLTCDGESPDRRAQAARHMCVMLIQLGRVDEARLAAMRSLHEMWLWPDTHLTLAEVEQAYGRPDVAIKHARDVIEIGKPNTLLIINPTQYTAWPRALISICLAQLGRLDEAVAMAEECLQIAPHNPLMLERLPQMRAQLKKHHAVTSFLASAEVLVECGEPLKARTLLEQAPFYVFDDPRLVKRRGELHALIGQRLAAEREAVEDPGADAFIERMRDAA